MSDKYTLVHEGLSQWINSPNNGGECCQTWADTVDELNRLLARIKLLHEAGDAVERDKQALKKMLADMGVVGSMGFGSTVKWVQAREAKL